MSKKSTRVKPSKKSQSKANWITAGVIALIVILGATLLLFMDNEDSATKDGNLTASQVAEKLKSGDEFYTYFYQTGCVHCEKVKPYLVPLGEQQDIPFEQIDLAVEQSAWDTFGIEGTPTVVHFKDGKEVSRVAGEQTEESYKEFFAGKDIEDSKEESSGDLND
ncbi:MULTISPECIES: thioredoxin family protein [Exiguobacterium]|uniref:Thiol reductase thioredoxin n=1 Tax=Exiguobacterium oxidotolerans TaxID=223958 RepID=A0A653IG68_9BACL|nr:MULTISPECIES: thioredoxin family protein [Exiguobacterium]ASI34727.1 thiol reductase thioredoxin [Exiguobacterium sp. N4-1P]VWX38101.1 Thiol reductase thioredoxin [Exiguobacterium oxidotolerans]